MNFLSKPRKPIAKVSAKRQVQLNEYFGEVRPTYLSEHSFCQVKDCKNKAVEIHHKKSRNGQLLNDTAHFLAVCRGCHQKIELSPLWAKENGYSEKRN